MKHLIFLFSFLSMFCIGFSQQSLRLEDLDISRVRQRSGIPKRISPETHDTIFIGGKSFVHGLRSVAESIFEVDLLGNAGRFKSVVGIGKEAEGKGSVVFKLLGDGIELWSSGKMKSAGESKSIDVSLKGIQKVVFFVTDAGNWDQLPVYWANPVFTITGDAGKIKATIEETEILTPKPGPQPKINGAKILGVKPGSPFLFTIPVTGKRPMTYSVINLPTGLVLNSTNGQITGILNQAGTYSVTLMATNSFGTDQRKFTIACGDQLALTPPMGWNSYNLWGCSHVSDQNIRNIADAFVSKDLINYGWTYVNIDCGWAENVDSVSFELNPNSKFPDMKSLCSYIHGLGLKAGIYSTPWTHGYDGRKGASADSPKRDYLDKGKSEEESRVLGKYYFEEIDAKQYARWGFDYLKYDWTPNDIPSTERMSVALKAQNRDIIYSLSNEATHSLGNDYARLSNSWRTTDDINDTWASMSGIGFNQDTWRKYAGPGHWNDADMLVIGKVGWHGESRPTKLTPNEQYTHISLWSLLASPLLLGCDLTAIDDFTLGLITNSEVIDINQDPKGSPAALVEKTGDNEIWVKDMEDGSKAVGLFNRSFFNSEISLDFTAIGIKNKCVVRDVWRQKDLDLNVSGFKTKVPGHGVVLLRLFPVDEVNKHAEAGKYNGIFCSGSGDADFLRLIDESFAFFHANPVVPNVTMIYNSDWNTFTEGAGWGAWWIQNSYGFSYAATPFLQDPWFSILQRSWDLFWDNQGDGIRKGLWGDGTPNQLSELVAPDGGLGDTAAPGKIIYKQGDGDVNVHDWFYEATAAALVMEAEILLVNRDKTALSHYLPKMERACNFIEKTRDPKNSLFLVGPACNLLAPSYGGVKQPDGSFGKGYLAGLSITYLAALDRMVELYKLTGNKEKQELYQHRQSITRESLPLLQAPGGYFVKSLEPGGTKHGVLGQSQFGYLEGVANADAVGLRVADAKTSEQIYNQIASYPAIRPYDFLLTNAPGLDDTYGGWGRKTGKGMEGFWKFGDWVNGGVWGTVEGRAILMYYRLGKFEDIRRSANRAMKWAKDFRMDAPWSQQGENTHNPWSDEGKFRIGGVAVMVDNFAIPAATIRGLFDYDYRADRIVLRPRIPGSITRFTQNEPVRFGSKKLFLTCINGGPKIKSVKVNGYTVSVSSKDEVALLYNDLPDEAKIEITTEGEQTAQPSTSVYPQLPELLTYQKSENTASSELPDSLGKPYQILLAMKKKLESLTDAADDLAFITEALKSMDDYRIRTTLNAGPGYYRPLTPERTEGINRFYKQTALTMYKGFVNRMNDYAARGNPRQKQLATLYFEILK